MSGEAPNTPAPLRFDIRTIRARRQVSRELDQMLAMHRYRHHRREEST